MVSAWDHLREGMVEHQLRGRDIHDPRVLHAMGTVERHLFVEKSLRNVAYDDTPLSIRYGQTISQPYIVAFMTQSLDLRGNERVLEVGTGCGYQSAVLSMLAKEIFALEIVPELVVCARENLAETGCNNVTIIEQNGYGGLPEKAPFDAILVAAAAVQVPQVLIEQLAENGRMIIPIGMAAGTQELCFLRKVKGVIEKEMVMCVRFVPLVQEVIDE